MGWKLLINHNYAQSDQALLMYSRVNIPPPFSIISACIWLLVKFPVLLGPYSHMFNKIEYFPFAASGTLVIAECHPFTRENGTVQVFGFVIDPELNKSLFIAALLKLLLVFTLPIYICLNQDFQCSIWADIFHSRQPSNTNYSQGF